MTDRLFKNGFYNTVALQSSYSKTYCYYFEYETEVINYRFRITQKNLSNLDFTATCYGRIKEHNKIPRCSSWR